MDGPAYPIIKRIRIPRGPHRLRDRRWPPVELSAPDAAPESSQAGLVGREMNDISADLKTEHLPAAGSEESIDPETDSAIWEERSTLPEPKTD